MPSGARALPFLDAIRLPLWGPDRAREYTRFLQQWGERVYLATILRESARLGVVRSQHDVDQIAAAWRLEARERVSRLAGDHAAKIVATHDRMIRAAAERILEEHPTYNSRQLGAALARYDRELSAWKARQIQETERFAFYQAAFEDFYRNNSDRAALFSFLGSLQCGLCQEIAAENPHTLDSMRDVDDPPHIGCLDIWEPWSA
jgi:hypothetical protein